MKCTLAHVGPSIIPTGLSTTQSTTAGRVDDALRHLEAATESGELSAISGAPARLRAALDTASP